MAASYSSILRSNSALLLKNVEPVTARFDTKLLYDYNYHCTNIVQENDKNQPKQLSSNSHKMNNRIAEYLTTMTTIYNIILFLFVLVIFFLDGIIGLFTVGWEAVATATTDAAPC
jgi:ribosomal protein S17E